MYNKKSEPGSYASLDQGSGDTFPNHWSRGKPAPEKRLIQAKLTTGTR